MTTREMKNAAKVVHTYTDTLTDRELYLYLERYMNLTLPLCKLIAEGIANPTKEAEEWIRAGTIFVEAHKAGKVTRRVVPAAVSKLSGKPFPETVVFDW